MADKINLTDFFERLRNSLPDLSRRLQFNVSEDTLDFVNFRLQQILQHLVHFVGGLDGVPQSIIDVRPFSVRVILSLVEGSAFCSLKAKKTDERSCPRVLAMEIWRECCWLPSSSPSAVSTTRPAPRCPRRRPITKNSPVLLPGWTSRILRPFKVSCTSFSSRESRPW